jgi:hypothetical protein
MEELRRTLSPLTDWIPPDILAWLPVEACWLLELVVLLALLLLAGSFVRALWRALFRRRRRRSEWDRGLVQDLESCPNANGPHAVSVYHVPARLRLVIVAPGGKGVVVEKELVTILLERAIPGLAAVIEHDHPRICIWPAQLSAMGFTNSFHRCTPTGLREEEPSSWVLLAGRAQGGGVALFVGLGLWSEEPTTLGRRNLEPHQWLDILRMAAARPL